MSGLQPIDVQAITAEDAIGELLLLIEVAQQRAAAQRRTAGHLHMGEARCPWSRNECCGRGSAALALVRDPSVDLEPMRLVIRRARQCTRSGMQVQAH